jgi:hypothetical protein
MDDRAFRLLPSDATALAEAEQEARQQSPQNAINASDPSTQQSIHIDQIKDKVCFILGLCPQG